MTAATALEASTDAFLGGRFAVSQPIEGHHRAGLDAILLASAVEPDFSGMLMDVGAGTGVAGFAVAARCRDARITLVERDPVLVECAEASLALPQNRALAGRVTVVAADIRDAATQSGLSPASADTVIMNPPFHDPDAGTRPAAAARSAAYVLEDGLDPWFRAAAAFLKPHASMIVIFRADRLGDVLAASDGRFGDLAALPVAPRADEPATRVIVSGQKGSRAPLRLLPPLFLHGPTGNGYLRNVEAILREGLALSAAHPAWAGRR